MSCSCGQNPCFCVPSCNPECADILEYTASNINLAGIGVFDGLISQEFQFRGIRSTNGNISVAYNAGLNTIDLTISEATFQTTVTFANDATRGNTIPDFVGQVGVQLDTNVIYTSTGTNAGDWVTTELFISGQSNTVTTTTTSLSLMGGSQVDISSGDLTGIWDFTGVNVKINTGSLLEITSTGVLIADSGSTIQNNGFEVWTSLTRWFINVAVPASSVLCTTTTAGQPTSKAISQFLSTDNTSAYGAPTGTLSRLTFDESTVTLPQLAQRVAALITDLKATLKPV